MATERRYPVGIQTFSEIIREGYLYVDKTDLVWKLAHYSKFIFMSRPRRFGKSLLTSTLDSYFKGDRELFEGLKIMSLEKEWTQYPVLHLDLSVAKGKSSPQELQRSLILILKRMDCYEEAPNEVTPGEKLDGLIRRLYKKTGRQVAVIIDEYDAPLLDVLHSQETLDAMRKVMQEFYVPLKANEAYLKFCFITGITKFSQLSIFSTINNLLNVSLDETFATICGFTEKELCTTLWPDIERLAAALKMTPEQMHDKLKLQYDGYHFAAGAPEVYNPFSLLNCFVRRKVSNYWFASGTPTFLIKQMQHFHTDITSLDSLDVPESAFDQPTENMKDALPLLYQSGYLTIKDYDPDTEAYELSIPNQEVRVGYIYGLLPTYTGLNSGDVQIGFAAKFWKALKQNDIGLAMEHMQSYLAGIPYVEGFKQKLAEATTKEGFYEYTFYLIFSMLNVYVRTQVKVAGGRTDMVIFMPDTIYVMELKVGDSARQALDQINARGYAKPYLSDGRRVVKVGVRFDTDKHTVSEWETEEA
ncbi:ATP-binding protein [Prevotella lacticifex]|uniref:ATP-binding protein n=1 Tax=Prevotella lacticifex TaxID=2854755 RepID=UPI001CC7E8A1|nr:ATP-binding protein [Prevotella lacticifex]